MTVDTESMENDYGGKIALKVLGTKGFTIGDETGPVIAFHLAHNDRNSVKRLQKEAKEGSFNDTHVVVLTCFDILNYEGREGLKGEEAEDALYVRRYFEETRDALIRGNGKGGAGSVVMPTTNVNIPAATLALLVLKNDPSILHLGPPDLVIAAAYQKAAELLAKCRDDKDPLAKITEEFGNENACKFFQTGDNQLDTGLFDRVLRALQTEYQRFGLFVRDMGLPARVTAA